MTTRKALTGVGIIAALGFVADVVYPSQTVSPAFRLAIAGPILTLMAIYAVIRVLRGRR